MNEGMKLHEIAEQCCTIEPIPSSVKQKLLNYIRSVAPEIQFSSIILKKYERGDQMGAHVDGNIFPTQFCGRFGAADGAELCVGWVRVETVP